MNLLTIEHLTKSYTERLLFDDTAFSINEGEKVGLIGINGTGKSTLLRIAAGLEEPDEGSVVKGRSLYIRYLPQIPEFQDGETVLEAIVRENENEPHFSSKEELKAAARSMLNRLEVPDCEAKIDTLSGGQRKRVALASVLLSTADLLILDVMMPGLDGIRTTLKVRENSSIPIIILSAKSEDADKILGLNIGADDYITKPFNPLELVARVKSQLRRYTQLGNLNQQEQDQVYKCGGLQINDDNKEVTVDGEPIKLTPIEYNILLLLVKNAGKVFSIDEIYEQIWNEEAIGADNTVAVHIRHIREKIEINPREPKYLKVVWGVGYKIEKQ